MIKESNASVCCCVRNVLYVLNHLVKASTQLIDTSVFQSTLDFFSDLHVVGAHRWL